MITIIMNLLVSRNTKKLNTEKADYELNYEFYGLRILLLNFFSYFK